MVAQLFCLVGQIVGIYTNAVPASKPMIKPELANDPFLYPSEAQMADYFVFKPQETDLLRATNKLWLRFKSGL